MNQTRENICRHSIFAEAIIAFSVQLSLALNQERIPAIRGYQIQLKGSKTYGTLLHNRNILPACFLTLTVCSFIFAQEKILPLSQYFTSEPNKFFFMPFFFFKISIPTQELLRQEQMTS